MITHRTFATRNLVSIALAASMIAAAAPVLSQPNDTSTATTSENAATRQSRMQQHLQARLDRMAQRLKIDASQQEAWAGYVRTVQGMIGAGLQRPAADADAATVTRFRAQLAAEHAQKLSQLADATAALEQTLNPEQRTTLNEIVRHAGHGMHGGHHRGG